MRLIFVNRYFHPDESATAQLLSDLAFGLAARRWEVHVLCSRQLHEAPRAGLPAAQTLRQVAVHRVWTTRFGRGSLAGRALDYLSFHASSALALLRLTGPGDLIIAKTDPPLLSVVAAGVARVRGATLVNWLQDVFPEVAQRLGTARLPAGLGRLLARLRDASLNAAAVNVVLGGRMADYLRGRCPRANFTIIGNWADADAVRPQDAQGSRLRAGMQPAPQFVVGYSGNLGRAHEYDTLLGAAELLRDAPMAFLMIGGGAKMRDLKTVAARRGLDRFHFVPHQPRADLQDGLAAADVHLVSLLPPLEGLIVPSKFYGILAAGRPTVFIGDPDGEVARALREHRCGIAVRPGDCHALAGVLRSLAADPPGCRAMGAAARSLLCGRHDAATAIGRWHEILEAAARLRVPAGGGVFPSP